MNSFQINFTVRVTSNGDKIRATVSRFALQTVQYLVRIDSADRSRSPFPLVLSGNKQNGKLEYSHVFGRLRLLDTVAIAIRKYCVVNHIPAV